VTIFVSVTASFQLLYVFVAMEVGSRILHLNVTADPTAEWTTQQFREFLAFDHPYGFVIRDRDAIFSSGLDADLAGFGVRTPTIPCRSPQANAHCERLVGTIRRDCLAFLIPLNEGHLKGILREYVRYYNRGRPHSALGPGSWAAPSQGSGWSTSAQASRRLSRCINPGSRAACTINIGWKRRPHDGALNYCGAQ
jgi:hypothetical protein